MIEIFTYFVLSILLNIVSFITIFALVIVILLMMSE